MLFKMCSFPDFMSLHFSECPFARDTNKCTRFFCLLSARIRNAEQLTCLLLTKLIMISDLRYNACLRTTTHNVKKKTHTMKCNFEELLTLYCTTSRRKNKLYVLHIIKQAIFNLNFTKSIIYIGAKLLM
jgi:hypothetical protein